MSISRWFTPPHLGFLCTVIEMTTQLTKYFCHFTKGEYTTPYWLEVTWRKKLLDLTWLEQLCDLTWLEKKIAMTWLDSRLKYFWLDLTCDSSKGDLLQHCPLEPPKAILEWDVAILWQLRGLCGNYRMYAAVTVCTCTWQLSGKHHGDP